MDFLDEEAVQSGSGCSSDDDDLSDERSSDRLFIASTDEDGQLEGIHPGAMFQPSDDSSDGPPTASQFIKRKAREDHRQDQRQRQDKQKRQRTTPPPLPQHMVARAERHGWELDDRGIAQGGGFTSEEQRMAFNQIRERQLGIPSTHSVQFVYKSSTDEGETDDAPPMEPNQHPRFYQPDEQPLDEENIRVEHGGGGGGREPWEDELYGGAALAEQIYQEAMERRRQLIDDDQQNVDPIPGNVREGTTASSIHDLEEAIEELQHDWIPDVDREGHMDPTEVATRMFDVGAMERLTPQHIQNKFKYHFNVIITLTFAAQSLSVYDADGYQHIKQTLNRCLEILHYSRLFLHSIMRARMVMDPDFPGNDDPDYFRFSTIDRNKLSATQDLINHALNQLYNGTGGPFRRYHDEFVYQQIYTQDGNKSTNAWRIHPFRSGTIKNFLYSICDRHEKFSQYLNITAGNACRHAVEYLSECHDPQFPDLEKDRYQMSFNDGIYDLWTDRFHAYADGPYKNRSGKASCVFHPFNFASKYLDWNDPIDFGHVCGPHCPELHFWDKNGAKTSPTTPPSPNHHHSPLDIPTPWFEKIMNNQKWPFQVKLWCYIMFGRCFYWLDDLDKWQVMAFFKGASSCGKSTFCKVLEGIYDPQDVGVISNQTEKQFGISSYFNRLILTAPEVKKTFNMDQAELQSMLAAEAVEIRLKHQTARKVDQWKIPVLMAGNELPHWDDAQGAMARRVICFLFLYSMIDHSDTNLLKRIQSEIPFIILKCNRIYRQAVAHYKDQSIWKILPGYFRKTKDEFQQDVSPIHAFLNSEAVSVQTLQADGETRKENDEVYVPLTVLKEEYMKWRAKTMPNCRDPWNKDTYGKAFDDFKLHIGRKQLKYPRGPDISNQAQTRQLLYVFGVDLLTECERIGEVDKV